MTHLKYRPDIDGLRAVAVLAVVLYHAFPRLLPGGFIGVDVFFVISGYLISGILYKGMREGDFCFREFYARRVRRLFPALITVLLLCLGYGGLVLLPAEYEQMGKHMAAGIVFIQNIVFWQESGYFDIASSLKPLLHLWSLAVEEQFYILFPPLLLLFWKKKWPMSPLILTMLGISLLANLVMSYQSHAAAFFLTPFRVWEFLAGAQLAWWHYGMRHEEEAPCANLLSIGGALLLAAGMVVIHMSDPFPGWRAVLPVLGSVMVIAAGSQPWVNRNILSNSLVVWIGLISYPLYLFHWPALSFVRIVRGNSPGDIYIVGALGAAIFLSAATYFLIERPLRLAKSRWIVPILSAAFVFVGLLGWVVWDGRFSRNLGSGIDSVLAAQNDRFPIGKHTDVQGTMLHVGGNGKQTLFVGDSHMAQYWPRIQNLLKSNPQGARGAILVSSPGVPPIRGVRSDYYDCEKTLASVNKLLDEDRRIDRVVLAARWGIYFKQNSGYYIGGECIGNSGAKRQAFSLVGEMIRELTAKNIHVTVVLGTPTGEKLAPQNMLVRHLNGKIEKRVETLTQQDWSYTAKLSDGLSETAISNGADVIDPVDYLCADGICISENEQGPIRYDKSHLRPGYIREHLSYLDATVEP